MQRFHTDLLIVCDVIVVDFNSLQLILLSNLVRNFNLIPFCFFDAKLVESLV